MFFNIFCLFLESNRQPSKRRKRKSSASTNAVNNAGRDQGPGKKNRSPGPQGFNPVPGVSTRYYLS